MRAETLPILRLLHCSIYYFVALLSWALCYNSIAQKGGERVYSPWLLKSTSPSLPKQKCYQKEFACIVTTAGVLQISRDRDDRRIFWSLKFSIPGFNWVVNIRWYDEETNTVIQFLTILLFHVFNAFWKFLRLGNLTFWGGLLEALVMFLGFDFCPHSIIPVTWNPKSPLG